jgi:uncharacterized protein (DUF362 family)
MAAPDPGAAAAPPAAGTRVAVVSRPGLRYHEPPPFAPPNPVYLAVEELLRELGLDRARAGTPEWNPLGDLIAPGDRVIVKPNFVSSRNLHERIAGEKLEASSTHGSLLRPILDYALRAAGPRGQVRVVDCPVEGCEIDAVVGPLGVRDLVAALRGRGHDLDFVDLRYFHLQPRFLLDDVRRVGRSFNLGLLERRSLAGDPRGYRVVDLGEASRFEAHPAPLDRLCFHRSHRHTPVAHHRPGHHEYGVPGTVLDADVVINLPKLKTHKKTGVTLALKSFIGLSHEKYWLPHFTAGSPEDGGDEYDRPQGTGDRLESFLSRVPLPFGHSLVARAPRVPAPPRVIDGSWEGNQTLWRTILDLNRAVLFADRDGRLRDTPQRRYLAVVDGIVAGEGEGPLGATPVRAGLLVGGRDPSLVDHVAAQAMGLDPERVPLLREALGGTLLPSGRLEALDLAWDGPRFPRPFRPPRSWPSLLPPTAR